MMPAESRINCNTCMLFECLVDESERSLDKLVNALGCSSWAPFCYFSQNTLIHYNRIHSQIDTTTVISDIVYNIMYVLVGILGCERAVFLDQFFL